MPIYAYRCSACGHAQDVLQKLSDPVLTTCPSCGQETYAKQVTAAGFQLKGSGWYVTDFRNGNTGAKPEAKADAKSDAPDAPAADGAAKPAADAPASAPAAAPATASPAPAATSPSPPPSSQGSS
jgi:putative FmdB family regulatory protein